MPDERNQGRVQHLMFEMVMERTAAIACGREDGNDLDRLRHDPLMKLAVGRCPETGAPLAGQSTISRLENAPTQAQAARLTWALVDQYCASVSPGRQRILDIDDTFCVAHGGQQLSFWNAHHDERGFAPMHIYDIAAGVPVVALLRPGRTPKGSEVASVIGEVSTRIKRHWQSTFLIWRGDGHFGRVEAMEACEANGHGYILGLAGNARLDAHVAQIAGELRTAHALGNGIDKLRAFASFEHQLSTWKRPRRVVARLEASWRPDPTGGYMIQEIDVRYVVTSLSGTAKHLYESVYCQRGQMENLIKLHKAQLASDRLSCHSAAANQVRLVLHTAAFWLMHGVRSGIPRSSPLAKGDFATIRERLIKIGARVIEKTARIRVTLPTSCPDAAVFRLVALGLAPSGP